jgi:hypothetical protein
MFRYDICTESDKEVFKKQCHALERHISGLKKGDFLEDVDGSETQLYIIHDKKISVHNSQYIGAVYVESDIDLTPYFKR